MKVNPYPTYIFKPSLFEEEKITPYHAGGAVNYPGVTNAPFILYDLYYTAAALFNSIRQFDYEELLDSFIRLIGIPASASYVAGGVIYYAKLFGQLVHLPMHAALYPMGIGGPILCAAELIVETTSLLRQKRFEKKLDFDSLSPFRLLLFHCPSESDTLMALIEKANTSIQQKGSTLKDPIHPDQQHAFQEWVNTAYAIKQAKPETLQEFVKHSSPFLRPIAKKMLIDHLETIDRTYLSITAEEIHTIAQTLLVNNPTLKGDDIGDLLTKEIKNVEIKKQKRFARRVMPWAVIEANDTIRPLIDVMQSNETKGLQEGFQFSEDLRIQSRKKTSAHFLAMVTLLFAIGSIACLLISCPIAVPYVVAGVALTFGLLRLGIFSGTLESRRWTFEPKKIIPLCIRKKLFSDPGINPTIEHPYRKSLLLAKPLNAHPIDSEERQKG